MSKNVAVILAQGFEEIEAVVVIDVLRRGRVNVNVAGLGSLTVAGSHGITITADRLVTETSDNLDGVVLPGGMPGSANLGASRAVEALVRSVYQQGGIVGAICAAPALTLAPWGLLEGRRATCYPSFEKHFSKKVHFCEQKVVHDGTIVTSRGPGTVFEFSLTILAALIGKDQADVLAQGMLLPCLT